MSPEQLTKNDHFDQKSDIWSLGIILHELLFGKRPFRASSIKSLAQKISSAKINYEADYWESVSIEAMDFIEKLLVKDPVARMDAASLLKESWLNTQSLEDRLLDLRYEAPL